MNVLRFGASGSAVKLLQQLLAKKQPVRPAAWVSANPRAGAVLGPRSWPLAWEYPIPEDGYFGAKTEAALEAFQHAHHLLVDGIAGGNTWSALLEGTAPAEPATEPLTSRVELVPVGSRVVDSYPFSQGGTAKQAEALKSEAVDGFIGYLGVLNRDRVERVLDAGLGFLPVTLANRFDGAAAVRQAQGLGYPKGGTIALDIEGRKILGGVEWPLLEKAAKEAHVREIFAKCAGWRDAVKAGGYKTMLYVGSPQPFTSKELGDLAFDSYWNALSREADRFGALAEPSRGYSAWQMLPELFWRGTGVWVDVNMFGEDFRKTLPSWAVRA